jgi:hypothetical protein
MKHMTSGAVRKRVGRPKSGKQAVWFWIRTETADLLRKLLPSRERSAFVDEVIRRELEKTQESRDLSG